MRSHFVYLELVIVVTGTEISCDIFHQTHISIKSCTERTRDWKVYLTQSMLLQHWMVDGEVRYLKQANTVMRGGSLITDFWRYTDAAHVSSEALREVFGGRVISRGLCSPRSPDLTPCELFVSVGVRMCFGSSLCLLLQGMFSSL